MKTITCTCKSAYQDSKYGQGKRKANKTAKVLGQDVVYRCTVCNKEGVK